MILSNRSMRVFVASKEDKFAFYMRHTGAFRVMMDGAKARIILNERVVHGYVPLLIEMGDLSAIEILSWECGRPDEYQADKRFIVLKDCKIRRMWFPRPALADRIDAEVLMAYVEYEAQSWEMFPIREGEK